MADQNITKLKTSERNGLTKERELKGTLYIMFLIRLLMFEWKILGKQTNNQIKPYSNNHLNQTTPI